MTFREKLADWISGGALSQLKIQLSEKDKRFKESLHGWDATQSDLEATRLGLRRSVSVLSQIYEGTKGIKSGTAQKIHRMAKEALGE